MNDDAKDGEQLFLFDVNREPSLYIKSKFPPQAKGVAAMADEPRESSVNVGDVKEAAAASKFSADMKVSELLGASAPGFWINALIESHLERSKQHAKVADAVTARVVDAILDNPMRNARADRMTAGPTEGIDLAKFLKATTDAVGSGGGDLAAIVRLVELMNKGGTTG